MAKNFDTVSRPDHALSFGSVAPTSNSTDCPNIIDISNQDVNGSTLLIHVNGYAGSGNVVVKLQQGTTSASFSDVSGVTTGNLTADGEVKVLVKGVDKRYLKAVVAGASTITAGTVDVELYTGV